MNEEQLLEVVRNIFTEPERWKEVGPRLRHRELDGVKIGVVLATQTGTFRTPALNKSEFERLRNARRDGKIDHALVVWAKINGGRYEYRGAMTPEEVLEKLDQFYVPTRNGPMGEFYVLQFFTMDESVGW
jgi:hypothetical protein